ncbi:aminodeoxychorismate synthase component I [Castellaniella sp.]|uniref:aminodeoxychorismate synthase component I n=1 Tax=Castellaniella sp. TaxID=1955812 RepID=UPI002AFDD757|nr:aminodeoxychorismate synthase component I [Castellaniella sp.]
MNPPSGCLFENRLSGWSLQLDDPAGRIAVHRRSDLPAAWAAIESARRAGCWVALLLDYELGTWLDDGLGLSDPYSQDADALPRLTALVYAQAREQGQWAPNVGPDSPASPPARDASALLSGALDLRLRCGRTRTEHARAISAIRQGIARGDYYQVNYTMPLTPDWPTGLSPVQVYQDLTARHPVSHAACLQDGERWVLSLSPELFVARQGSLLTTRPMKGTAPRHADPIRDRHAADTLLRSEKNRAENLMIVDLLRNDLGRIATPGTVRVPALFSLEGYPSVWTLTSTVQAEAPDVPISRVLQALFPCGSVTGAPKIAAMRAIRTLENRRRGIYCGSVGWLAPNGDFSLNVAIRTIEVRDGQALFGVGGGIVADSRADEEWRECRWKARILDRWNPYDDDTRPRPD